jgi:hypothetical protein
MLGCLRWLYGRAIRERPMIGPMGLRALFFAYSVLTYDYKEPSDRWVPCPPGIVNGWGPEATKMREKGELPPVVFTDEMNQWQAWGDGHLKNGDLVHRQGDAYIAGGLYPFSRNLAKLTDSRYSHSALVVFEEGHAFIYDATQQSVRRQPFSVYMLDMAGAWCVQRAEGLDVAKAVEFIKDKWGRQVPFDFNLSSDDKAYYCVELAVKAYRAGGVDLGRPTPLLLVPGVYKWKVTLYVFSKFGLKLGCSVWYVGNYQHGILSSKKLKTIFAFEKKGTASDKSDQHDSLRSDHN